MIAFPRTALAQQLVSALQYALEDVAIESLVRQPNSYRQLASSSKASTSALRIIANSVAISHCK